MEHWHVDKAKPMRIAGYPMALQQKLQVFGAKLSVFAAYEVALSLICQPLQLAGRTAYALGASSDPLLILILDCERKC